jgi:hypothetical protein
MKIMKTKLSLMVFISIILILNGCKKSDDTSNNPVNKTQSITVTTPNGGETWVRGTSYTIKWTSTGVTGNVQIRCDYSGVSIPIDTVDVSAGQFTFTVPTDPSEWPSRNDWVAVVTAFGVTPSGGDVWGTSNQFSIGGTVQQSITITDPIGGEVWEKGSTHMIKWTSTGITGNVEIRCDHTGISMPIGNVNISAGQFPITVQSNWPSRNDWVVVVTAYGVTPSGGDVWDTSNPISIGGSAQQSITVTTPSGGETWTRGTSHTITWTSIGVTGQVQIRCDYPGTSISVNESVDVSDGQYTFTVPTSWPSRNDWNAVVTAFGATPSGGDVWDASYPFTIN